ncbi:terpene synthase family protein [Algoriphagus resistens]|uniref:terpene synthase family protein n=1 Tax=Algoriphagus resistens TaxID=1750590 RepID=UPI0007168F47|nr:terpene synthase family protein [Algoriphagus resistens]
MHWKAVELKHLLDPLDVVSKEAYQKVGAYIKYKSVKGKKLIKPSARIEHDSRILLSGLVGMFRDRKLIRIFFPNEIMMDAESYFYQTPSKYEFRSFENSSFTLLSREGERKLLLEVPEFSQLSTKLISIARESNDKWLALSQLPWREVLEYLKSKDPELELKLSQKHISDVLNVNVKTLYRHRVQAYQEVRNNKDKEYLRKKLSYSFKSVLYDRTEELNIHVFAWATYFHGFLDANKDEKNYDAMKLPWLSARLYPEADWLSACWLSKFFLLLFMMDDATDKIPKGLKKVFWQDLSTGFNEIINHTNLTNAGTRIVNYLRGFQSLWEDFETRNKNDQKFFSLIQNEIIRFLESNLWEANNKDAGIIPSIDEYADQRPLFSGERLAIVLSPMGMGADYSELEEAWSKTAKIRELAEKLIVISNDLFSFPKEKLFGDYHNWISLLGISKGMKEQEARDYLIAEHERILGEFMEEATLWTREYNPDNDLVLAIIKQVKFKISGALEWSVRDTERYFD